MILLLYQENRVLVIYYCLINARIFLLNLVISWVRNLAGHYQHFCSKWHGQGHLVVFSRQLLWSRESKKNFLEPGSSLGWLEGWAQLGPFLLQIGSELLQEVSPVGLLCWWQWGPQALTVTVPQMGKSSSHDLGLETGKILSTYYWPKQSQCLPRFKGGGWNLLNGKRIKELVAAQQHPSYTKCSISIRYYEVSVHV